MFSIKSNQIEQQLSVTIQNLYDEEDLKTIAFIIDRELSNLSQGWTGAVDLRGMRVLEQKLTHYINRIQTLFMDRGAERIVTLVDNAILKMQITRIGDQTGITIRSAPRFTNEDEWKRALARKT